MEKAFLYWIFILFYSKLIECNVSKVEGDLSRISLKLKSDGSRTFVDEYGRERFFHGTNAVVKGPPWIPDHTTFSRDISMNEVDFQIMKDLGLNVLRLGTMWPGIEPEKGKYNMTYVSLLVDMAYNASTYGIYTLLDMHQDVLSEKFCGEGIPKWAARGDEQWKIFGKFPSPLEGAYETDEDGFPSRQDCNKHDWPAYHIAEDTAAGYEALWKNIGGIGDSWADMWNLIARTFKNKTHILGYELINEPFAGNFYHNPTMMIPLKPFSADYKNMQPQYDKLNDAIRKEHEEALIFFAGVTWDDFGVGFSHVPGGDKYANRSVVAYHYYNPPQLPMPYTSFQFYFQTTKAKKLGSGSMLTEFCSDLMTPKDVADSADAYLQSWATWEWKSFCRETNDTIKGKSQNAFYGSCKTGYGSEWENDIPKGASGFARTYAHAVAGETKKMYYNVENKDFELIYNIDLSISQPTIIYVSTTYSYPNGFTYTALPDIVDFIYDKEKDKNFIYIKPNAKAKSGKKVKISIKRN